MLKALLVALFSSFLTSVDKLDMPFVFVSLKLPFRAMQNDLMEHVAPRRHDFNTICNAVAAKVN
jgi:hypothetical protein